MPSVRITVEARPTCKARAIALGVRAALVEALDVVSDDQDVSIQMHPSEQLLMPTTKPEQFARVEVCFLAGPTLARKQKLYSALLRYLAPCGIGEIKLLIFEMARQNVAHRKMPSAGSEYK